MKKIIIASTSTVYKTSYLEYLKEELIEFFSGTDKILFIPYARPSGISHDLYTSRANEAFLKIGKKLEGIHEFENPQEALKNAQGVFVGGGNTFLLVTILYKHKLMDLLRERVLEGLPYLGTSAGANITGINMKTTNDMPIIYPPDFNTMGLVPFNINPHYLDPIPGNEHMGETRETRIKEFHQFNKTPVVGLREGSWLSVTGEKVVLRGDLTARIFEQNKPPYEIPEGSELFF